MESDEEGSDVYLLLRNRSDVPFAAGVEEYRTLSLVVVVDIVEVPGSRNNFTHKWPV